MAITSTSDVAATIAELETKIEKLAGLVERAPRRSWRRAMALVATAVLAVGMLAGVAGASGSTTNVTFVPLTPTKLLLSNVTIASKKTNSPVVIGGTTTVPADATTVELTVSAKGASAGTLQFYPALNPSGGSGQTLAYPGSNVVVSTTIQENVGQSGELTFYNNGIGSAVVTARIIGYSTQVTAGDINGVGGTSGQVLTNDGSGGAAWQTPNFALPDTATTVIHPTANAMTNGSALRTALTSGANKVVAIEPGTYDLGSSNLTFASGVTLIGAGATQSMVRIAGGAGISTGGTGGIVDTGISIVGNGDLSIPAGAVTTLRDDAISLTDTAASVIDTTISGDGGVLVIDGSTITATGGGSWAQAIRNGGGPASSIVVRNSTLTVNGSGAAGSQFVGVNAFSPIKVYDTQVTVSGGATNVGLLVQGGAVTVEGSELHAQYALYSFSNKAQVAATQVDGNAGATAPGSIVCVDSYNASFTAIGAGCF